MSSTTITPDPDGEAGRDFVLDHGDQQPYEAITWLRVGRWSLAITLYEDDSMLVQAYPHGMEAQDPKGGFCAWPADLPSKGARDEQP